MVLCWLGMSGLWTFVLPLRLRTGVVPSAPYVGLLGSSSLESFSSSDVRREPLILQSYTVCFDKKGAKFIIDRDYHYRFDCVRQKKNSVTCS